LAWNVEFTATAGKQLKKLDKKWQALILDYLEDEVAPLDNLRNRGKALLEDKKGLWRYRVGDYRAICKIEDELMVILAVTVGHRKDVYNE